MLHAERPFFWVLDAVTIRVVWRPQLLPRPPTPNHKLGVTKVKLYRTPKPIPVHVHPSYTHLRAELKAVVIRMSET